jgi:hypothetical protein
LRCCLVDIENTDRRPAGSKLLCHGTPDSAGRSRNHR